MSELSLLDLTITSPQTPFSIRTNLASLNTIPQKLSLSLYNKLVSAVSHQQVSCLCLLDICAAFDTIDHNILLQRLSSWFGVSGTALLWFQSYLSTRSFSDKACSHSSQPLPLSCGVPQGSVLGTLLFILYTTPLSHLIGSSSVDHHLCDIQLFISFSPNSFSISIAQLLSLVNQISQWMSSNLLCLNLSKTEFIIIGLSAQIKKIPDPSIHLSNNSSFTIFNSDASVRNLGVTFYPQLSFSTTSPTSPAPASCTSMTSAASDHA